MSKGKFPLLTTAPEEQLLQTVQENLLLQVLHHSFGSGSSHNINQGCFSIWSKF